LPGIDQSRTIRIERNDPLPRGRDGDPRAAWLELDIDGRNAVYRRTDYDIQGAAAAIREARLPDSLAERLSYGQ